jgi:S1-C subfamily serine protease|tara:strand:+ start:127 stop:1362 length:1236 start_codon:yes stop_codon:yes gene_type:complete
MKILGYILVIFAAANFASSFADETKLKLRKIKNNNTGSENISIKINPEMFILKDLKELKNQYKATVSFAKETDKLTKPRKKIKLRGATQNIYKNFAPSVVYIGNVFLENKEDRGSGAGFLIDRAGIIITNWHVVEKAERVAVWTLPKEGAVSEEILFKDIDPFIGAVVAKNVEADLALVKVNNLPKNIRVVQLGYTSDINIGDNVYAIGHPMGFPWSFTIGYISGVRKNHEWGKNPKHKATLIQNQTPSNPGNSGGPLFNENGKLVGVNTLKFEGADNLNFAVAVEHARKFIRENPNIKNVNPIEPTMKKNYPNAKTQDYNNNGVIDTWYIDENKNGKIDTAFLDDNEDGIIESILYDENENQSFEHMTVDDDLNGKPDRWFYDENDDNKYDVVAYDYDQDGKWDKYEKIS